MTETFYFRLKRRGWATRFISVKGLTLQDAFDALRRGEPSYKIEAMDFRSWERAKQAQVHWNEQRESASPSY